MKSDYQFLFGLEEHNLCECEW